MKTYRLNPNGMACLALVMGGALCGFAQDELPVARILTDSTGRKLEGILLHKDAASVKFRRSSDAKEFDLPLDKLSPADHSFIDRLRNPETSIASSKEPGFPEDFKFDQTLIHAGEFAFLALPFEQQGKGGICVAASMINILKFLDPRLQLGQNELFALFNGDTAGASDEQLLAGLATMGYAGEQVELEADNGYVIERIHQSLDNRLPILAGKRGHEVTLIGYRKAARTVILWDQRMPNMTDTHGMPMGSFELSESAFRARIVNITFIRPVPKFVSSTNTTWLQKATGLQGAFGCNQIVNGNSREESLPEFLRHAAAPRVAVNLRKKERVFVSSGNQVLEIISEPDGDGWDSQIQPAGKKEKLSQSTLLKLLSESNGMFFSHAAQSE